MPELMVLALFPMRCLRVYVLNIQSGKLAGSRAWGLANNKLSTMNCKVHMFFVCTIKPVHTLVLISLIQIPNS